MVVEIHAIVAFEPSAGRYPSMPAASLPAPHSIRREWQGVRGEGLTESALTAIVHSLKNTRSPRALPPDDLESVYLAPESSQSERRRKSSGHAAAAQGKCTQTQEHDTRGF